MRAIFRPLLLALFLWPSCACCVQIVRYPIAETAGDRRYEYSEKLLELALSKTTTAYRVARAAQPLNQDRQVFELEASRSIDVAPLPASADREARLLPIRIPLNKGLLGWRLGLVRKGDAALLSTTKGVADLKGIRIAQGHEWPDTEILRFNSIQVMTGTSYEGLFKMLIGGRFDYFPRSIVEIWGEHEQFADRLEIEPHLALHYLYDAYFFVNKNNKKLAEDIREGLEKAIADGSFQRLFLEHWGERIRQARLSERTVIELSNPLLTPQTPARRAELWYDPKRGR